MTQMSKTEIVAPITSARCHPKLILFVDGRLASHIENNEIMNDAKSVKRWAASVAMAILLLKTPPTTSTIMNTKHKQDAMINLRLVFSSIPCSRSIWQCVIAVFDALSPVRVTMKLQPFQAFETVSGGQASVTPVTPSIYWNCFWCYTCYQCWDCYLPEGNHSQTCWDTVAAKGAEAWKNT